MDVIQLTRKLGAAIQQDERYLAFSEARKANDSDEELASLLGKINIVQISYQREAEKGDDADEGKMEAYNKEFNELYNEVMLNPNMVRYEAARTAVDDMMNYTVQLLSLCVNGEDPETCEPQQEQPSCGHDCSGCAGC